MGGEVVQELRHPPGKAAAGLWASARRVRTQQLVTVTVAVDDLLGAPALSMGAVDGDGLDSTIHAVAPHDGTGTSRAENTLLFQQFVAGTGRAEKVPLGTLQ